MKWSFKKIMKHIDWIVAIPIGLTALVLSILGIDCIFGIKSVYLTGIAGILCVVYILYASYLWIQRPKFDWHLINGHFLAKVIFVVISLPLTISMIMIAIASMGTNTPKPKELVFDNNLYEENIEQKRETIDTKINVSVNDSISITKFSSCYSIDLDKTLPDSIRKQQTDPSIFWAVYYHFIDPGNQHMTTTPNGRGWSALIAILGAFLLNGLLVSSIVGWVDSRKEKWLKGEVKYPCFLHRKRHYVIIGGNDMVAGIVKQLLPSKKYILIQTSRDVESFRRELFSTLTREEQQRIIIYYGNRISKEDISHLGLYQAEEVYILGEDTRTDDIESYHDTMNMRCLALLQELYVQTPKGRKITAKIEQVNTYKKELSQAKDKNALRNEANNKNLEVWWKNRPRLNCRVMFEYQTTFSVFQFFDLNEQMDTYINFIPFNYYELWAQNVFINKCLDKKQLEDNFQKGGYLPLEGSDGIKINDEKYVHLFVVGMSRMGVALAIEAAHLAHYPNYEKKKIRTKITFIDKNAAEEKDFFMGRFKELFSLSHWRYGDVCDNNSWVRWHKPHVPSGYKYLGGDFIDIEWEFINGGIESSAIQNYILASANPVAKITIAICLPESNRSHAAALFLDKRIYASNSVLQVLAYNRYGSSIVNAISKSGSEYPFCGKLRSFGCVEDCVVRKHLALSEEIGEYIANAYAKGKPQYAINPESSYSGKSNTANRWSSIYNGNTLWTKLRCIDFNLKTFIEEQNNISILSDVEHNRWNVEELLMNFRYLEEEEQIAVINGEKKKKELKKKMAHLDICSNYRLMKVDGEARKNDVLLTEYLRNIYDYLKNKRGNLDD